MMSNIYSFVEVTYTFHAIDRPPLPNSHQPSSTVVLLPLWSRRPCFRLPCLARRRGSVPSKRIVNFFSSEHNFGLLCLSLRFLLLFRILTSRRLCRILRRWSWRGRSAWLRSLPLVSLDRSQLPLLRLRQDRRINIALLRLPFLVCDLG